MKEKILELLNGMSSDSKSASRKCEKELCQILTSIIDKKDKIETYADKYICDYPEKITNVTFMGVYDSLPEIIWCNDDFFKFETNWLNIDWESYFEVLKQSSIKSIERAIKSAEAIVFKHKEQMAILSHRKFEDLEF